jgi:hypothetical protein
MPWIRRVLGFGERLWNICIHTTKGYNPTQSQHWERFWANSKSSLSVSQSLRCWSISQITTKWISAKGIWLKKKNKTLRARQAGWYTPAIPGMQELEKKRSWFKASPGRKKLARPYLNKQTRCGYSKIPATWARDRKISVWRLPRQKFKMLSKK